MKSTWRWFRHRGSLEVRALPDDIGKERTRRGYTAIGRLKGRAELHGATAGLEGAGRHG